MVCHQGPWQVQRWWKLLGPRWLEPEKDGGIRYEKSPRRGERHFRLSKSQRPRVDSKFFYLRDYEKAWHNYKEFREGTEGWFVDLLSLSFWGAFRRRCFTDDCTNFMVKRSVWEEKETDRQTVAALLIFHLGNLPINANEMLMCPSLSFYYCQFLHFCLLKRWITYIWVSLVPRVHS